MSEPAHSHTPSKKAPFKASLWHLVFGLIGVFALSASIYFLVGLINTPTKIGYQLSITQPVFENYMLTISQITQHLEEDDDGADSDSMEREALKAQNLSKRADNTAQTLKELSSEISLPQLQDYRSYLNTYLDNTQKLITLEQENAKIYNHYSKIFRQYEEISLTIENANLYVTSNPDKYVEEMNSAIDKEKQLIEEMKQFESIPETKDLVEYSPKILEIEVEFIEKMVKGVQSRNYATLTTARQDYTRQQAQISKDINRIEDQFNDLIEDLKRSTSSQEDHIQNEYNRLVVQYHL